MKMLVLRSRKSRYAAHGTQRRQTYWHKEELVVIKGMKVSQRK